ncbi:retrovirus-related pol polyprotein from transposon TNT 1-94 [Tanacetum coccineum]
MNDAGTTVGPNPGGNSPESIRAISERFANAAYGFFLGKRVAYLIVANYVRNTWGKYGLIKSMLNSSTGIFSFQFSSMEGLVMMLENDPWSSFVRALIEVRVDVELKDNIVVDMPKLLMSVVFTRV